MPLLYSQNGPLAQYNPNFKVTKEYIYSQDTVFCGSAFLKEYLSKITESDVRQIFPEISAQLFQDIRNLEFYFSKEGDKVVANNPLLTVVGNPFAIQIINSAILSYIGGQTAVSTAARALVQAVKGLDNLDQAKPNLFPALQNSLNKRLKDDCAYLGLRRGEGGNAEDDYASWKGGFVAGANVNTAINRNKYRYIKTTMPVVGTIAHFWPMSQTALHNHTIKTDQLNDYLKCLGISAGEYAAVKADSQIDLNDYVAFRAYIRAVQRVEEKIKANTDRDVTKGIVLLVDTTDTIKGMHAAIQAVKDSGRKITGVRLDTSPEKYILEAANLLAAAGLDYVKIYCTDGIDLGTAKLIHDKCIHVENTIVYGIGSAVANTPALNLVAEISDINTKTNGERFCMAEEPVFVPMRVDEDQIPADFYALSQADFLNCLNELLAENGIVGFTNGGATLNFRFRKDTPNYLIMAGIDQVKRAIDKFEYNEDFIQMMKDLGLSYTDQEYTELFRGKKLNLELAYLPEGSFFGPYQAGVQVKGPIDQMLFVESFVLSTIGSMSAVATAAKELINTMAFSNAELQALPQEQKNNVCKLYNLSDVTDFAKHYSPYFVYMPEHEKRLSTRRCNAAFIGGFKATTMLARAAGLDIPFAEIGISYAEYCALTPDAKVTQNKVAINRNDNQLLVEISKLLHLKADGKKIQIISGFENAAANLDLRNKLLAANININDVEFFVGEPLSSKKNEKGLVYKTDFIEMQNPTGEQVIAYTIKAAGNKRPGVKNSIPAVSQRVGVLKHEGKPVATITYDAAMIGVAEDLLSVLCTNPQLYFMNNLSATADDIIAQGVYNFGSKCPDSFELFTKVGSDLMTSNEVMIEAQYQAERSYKLGLHRLPMLMENRMFENLQSQLSSSNHAHKKLRLNGDL